MSAQRVLNGAAAALCIFIQQNNHLRSINHAAIRRLSGRYHCGAPNTFLSYTVGTTSAAQTVSVDNPGATSFNLNPIQVSGDYSQTNNCGTSLAAGASCSIQVDFAPTASGTRTGVLTVASGGTSFTVNLTGTASAVTVNAKPSSGGGGALDVLSLLALSAMIELGRRSFFFRSKKNAHAGSQHD